MEDALALSTLLRSGIAGASLRALLSHPRGETGASGGSTPHAALAASALDDAQWRLLGVPAAAVLRIRRPDPRLRALDAAWLEVPGHRLIGWHDPDYPALLRRLEHPPAGLYVVGDVSLLWHPQVAVVGSRRPSAGGRDNARSFARDFAASGLVVCSGLAAGVDTEAHLGAMEVGRTVAVLGTGPDRCFPADNAGLLARIGAGHAAVTEHPPGTPGIASHFPSRNRLIAGLSLGTVVIEAALRSGALITARLAAEAGREAFAVPGSIHNPMARGCHRLIREGAGLAESAQDVIPQLANLAAELAASLRGRLACTGGTDGACGTGGEAPAAARRAPRERIGGSGGGGSRAGESPGPGLFPSAPPQHPGEALVWRCLGHDPVNLDQLSQRTGLTLGALSAMLLTLELEGRVTAEHGRYIRRS